jgi:hypothetical protein
VGSGTDLNYFVRSMISGSSSSSGFTSSFTSTLAFFALFLVVLFFLVASPPSFLDALRFRDAPVMGGAGLEAGRGSERTRAMMPRSCRRSLERYCL